MSEDDRVRPAAPVLPRGPIVALRYAVPSERRAALLEFLAGAVSLYESPGGIRVGLYEEMRRPGAFLELVAYAGEEDFAADQTRVETHPEWTRALARWREIVGGPIEVSLARHVALKRAPTTAGSTGAPSPAHEASAQEGVVEGASREVIAAVWAERWGDPIVTPWAVYGPDGVEGLCLRAPEGSVRGLVTWAERPDDVEIVTLDALEPGRGDGARLLEEAERLLRSRGRTVVRLVTSNDNMRAVAFYQRRGYRVVRLHLDALDAVRRLKPSVPIAGAGGIPLRDLWEMEKAL